MLGYREEVTGLMFYHRGSGRLLAPKYIYIIKYILYII